jgi:hypothetical protein
MFSAPLMDENSALSSSVYFLLIPLTLHHLPATAAENPQS